MDVLIQCGQVAIEYWPEAAAAAALWLTVGERLANLAAPTSRTAKILAILAAKVAPRRDPVPPNEDINHA